MRQPVAFLLTNLQGAGTQRAQLLLARGAVELGEQVDLVVCQKKGAFVDAIPEGVRLVDLGAGSEWTALPALVRYLRKEQPKAMVSALNQANLLALLAKRLSRSDTRLIMAVQNHFGAKWQWQWTPTAPLRRVLFRWMYQQADSVVAVSISLREYLIGSLALVPEKVVVVTNPVDVDLVLRNSRAPVTHPWLIEDKDTREIPVVISVGRLDFQKDHETLIRAFRVALETHPMRLLILGEGPLRKKLQRVVDKLDLQHAVQLPGFQSNPHAWMARADLFVLSSLWEGYPLVLIEAICLGCPTISTNCQSGPSEILRHFPDRLVPIKDVTQMADKIVGQLGGHLKEIPPSYINKSTDAADGYLRLIKLRK